MCVQVSERIGILRRARVSCAAAGDGQRRLIYQRMRPQERTGSLSETPNDDASRSGSELVLMTADREESGRCAVGHIVWTHYSEPLHRLTLACPI